MSCQKNFDDKNKYFLSVILLLEHHHMNYITVSDDIIKKPPYRADGPTHS